MTARTDRGTSRAAEAFGPVVATLDRPRVSDPVTAVAVADPHVAVQGAGTWKVRHRSTERLERAIALARGTPDGTPAADAVLFVGDLTHDGRRGEFDRFDALVTDLDVPWTGLPGNHDVPKSFDGHDGIGLRAFRRRYVGDAESPAGAEEYPTVLWVGDLRVVCLNTAAPTEGGYRSTWAGAVGHSQRQRLRDVLSRAPAAPTLLVAHHNLGPLPEHDGGDPWDRFPADDAAAVRETLADADVPLAVTGHHHVPAVRRHGPVTELMAPAVCSFPQAMLRLHVGPDGTTVRAVPLADSDGVREAYWYAATGEPLGRGVLELATDRVRRW